MSETRETKALQVSIEARMASGVGDVPHPLTAPERAAAMQQAREQAFNAPVSAPGYEDRRYEATSPTRRFTL